MKRKRSPESPPDPPPKRRKIVARSSPASIPAPSLSPVTPSSFADLGLHPLLLDGIRQRGYTVPRPIQQAVFPPMLSHRDVVAQSKNGTGKSVAIAMVALNSVLCSGAGMERSDKPRLQVIVLAPTRELVFQLYDETVALAKSCRHVSIRAFFGGEGENDDTAKFQKGCHIAIGTTGRIGKLMLRYAVPLPDLQLLVLDEADHLFSEVLVSQTQGILRKLSQADCLPGLQFLAMSATFDRYTRIEIQSAMKNPEFVTLTEGDFTERNLQIDLIREHYVEIPPCANVIELFQKKKRELISLLGSLTFLQCIVFCATAARCINVSKLLQMNGFPSEYIFGRMKKSQRRRTVRRLRTFETRVCVATDILSRGIDLSRVNVVVNLDLPGDSNTFMHRMGRTGRSGDVGLAVNFVQSDESSLFEYLRRKCTSLAIPILSKIPTDSYFTRDLSTGDLEKWNRLLKVRQAHLDENEPEILLNDADFLLPKLRRLEAAAAGTLDEEDETIPMESPFVRIQEKLSRFVNLYRDAYLAQTSE